MTTVEIVIFPDVEELDFVGPWEVLTGLRDYQAATGGDPVSVHLAAETAEPIRSAKGMRVLADHTFDTAPDPDVIVVPGGQGTRSASPALVDRIRKTAASATWVTSVCTGAYLLHQAGLIAGRTVTTHWSFVDRLAATSADQGTTVVGDQRFVVDGNLVTAAGVSAGIDMALWLAGQITTPETARQVQHYIEYHPEPPYQDEG